MTDYTRRRLLASAGAAGLAGIAGCAETGLLGSEDDDGGEDAPPAATYEQWLLAPSVLEQSADGYQFTAIDPAEMLAHEDRIEASLTGINFEETDGISGSNVSNFINCYVNGYDVSYTVMEGTYDEETVRTSLSESSELTQETSYHGFDIYLRERTAVAPVAFGPDTLLTVRLGSGDAVETVEAIIDSSRGEADRVTETSADAGALVDGLGGGTAVTGSVGHSDGYGDSDASGYSLVVGGGTTAVRVVAVYEETAETDADALASDASDTAMLESADVSAETDGRTAIVTGTLETTDLTTLELNLESSSDGEVSPVVDFSFDYDSAGTLTVMHTAGDMIRATELFVRGSGVGSTGSWTSLGGSASGEIGGDPAVAAGDSVTLDAESAYEVSVVWEGEGDSATLARDQGPDA